MAIRRICKYGEKILSKKTKTADFKALKPSLAALLADMFDTMDIVGGAGLAANQIGLDLRLAVIKVTREEDEVRVVIINPEIASGSDPVEEDEGCLSFPGLFAKIKRFSKVKVRALNEKGVPVEITAEGLLAKALQHEIDHLDGVLFIDHLPVMSRLKLKPVLMRLKRQWKKTDESRMVRRPSGGRTAK